MKEKPSRSTSRKKSARKTKSASKRTGKVAEQMRPEYDFRGGERGKYARRLREGLRPILLEPDVAEVFPDSESVNEILRALVKILKRGKPAGRSRT